MRNGLLLVVLGFLFGAVTGLFDLPSPAPTAFGAVLAIASMWAGWTGGHTITHGR